VIEVQLIDCIGALATLGWGASISICRGGVQMNGHKPGAQAHRA
jgi:hypothetical protein